MTDILEEPPEPEGDDSVNRPDDLPEVTEEDLEETDEQADDDA